MISASQMQMVQEELETLRDRAASHRATLEQVEQMQQMVVRMRDADVGGRYHSRLQTIADLLDAVRETMTQQRRLHLAATALRRKLERLGA